MKRTLPILLALTLGVAASFFATGVARAYYATTPTALQPPVYMMAPGSPTTQTTGSPGEVHVTLSAKGQCVQISCTADAAFLFSASSAPTTLASTDTGNDLPAKAVLTKCLPGTQDYVSIYGTAAKCKVAELVAP